MFLQKIVRPILIGLMYLTTFLFLILDPVLLGVIVHQTINLIHSLLFNSDNVVNTQLSVITGLMGLLCFVYWYNCGFFHLWKPKKFKARIKKEMEQINEPFEMYKKNSRRRKAKRR